MWKSGGYFFLFMNVSTNCRRATIKPPSSRSCSNVRYMHITSPPKWKGEKRISLPSMKGSNRHHLGVPPGLAPTHIIQYLTAKVNRGCVRAFFFFCRQQPFLKRKSLLLTERATPQEKRKNKIFSSRNTPRRTALFKKG